ncbi:hypothetical protein NGUA31_00160 [Salmonella enterica]|nr:hypothetical protein NGUA31_00160 [Salmonella enterica]
MQSISVAMWKGDARFRDEIGDRELFNERFIETRFGDGESTDLIYMLSMLHTISVAVLIAGAFSGERFWGMLAIYPIVNIVFFMGMWLLTKPSTRIRFNRQAQRVHVVDRGGAARLRCVGAMCGRFSN